LVKIFQWPCSSTDKQTMCKKIDEVFGLDLLKQEKVAIPKEIKDLVNQREQARKDKQWKLADEIREKIKNKGYQIDDTKDSAIVKKL